MKRIIRLFLSTLITLVLLSSFSYQTLDLFPNNSSIEKPESNLTITKDGYLEFTDQNFINLLSFSKEQWVSAIKNLGFNFFEKKDGVLMYTRGEFMKTWQTAIFDSKLNMVGLLWWDLENKTRRMDIYRSQMPLTPIYSENENDVYLRVINGQTYKIIVSQKNDLVTEEVRFGLY